MTGWIDQRKELSQKTVELNRYLVDKNLYSLVTWLCQQAVVGEQSVTECKHKNNIKIFDDWLNLKQLSAQCAIKTGMINLLMPLQNPTKKDIEKILKSYADQMKVRFFHDGVHGFDGKNYAKEIKDATRLAKKRKRT